MLPKELIDGVIAFHGHHCPGLTFGMRIGEWVRQEFGYAPDEEIVAVVETDMCAVDAIQYLTGCTFGKGNLIFFDYGKNAYSFFRRSDNKSVRLITRGGLLAELVDERKKLDVNDADGHEKIKERMIERIMSADFDEIFTIGTVQVPMPEVARIHQSFRCEQCGELVMATRLQNYNSRSICIPCLNTGKS